MKLIRISNFVGCWAAAGRATPWRPKGFDCTWTYYGRDADNQLCNGNDDRIAVLGRSDELLILSGIEAIEGPCPLFVCFGASWPVDCCHGTYLPDFALP
jgi:hypothetical protein